MKKYMFGTVAAAALAFAAPAFAAEGYIDIGYADTTTGGGSNGIAVGHAEYNTAAEPGTFGGQVNITLIEGISSVTVSGYRRWENLLVGGGVDAVSNSTSGGFISGRYNVGQFSITGLVAKDLGASDPIYTDADVTFFPQDNIALGIGGTYDNITEDVSARAHAEWRPTEGPYSVGAVYYDDSEIYTVFVRFNFVSRTLKERIANSLPVFD